MSTETYEYQSEFMGSWKAQVKAQFQAEGRAEGEAKAVLLVLDARKIDVSEGARARISECTDLDQLEQWVRRAATVDSTDELFE